MTTDEQQRAQVPRMYMYPADDGSIRLEWVEGDWDISLDVDVKNKSVYYHALNLKTGECVATDA